MGKCGNDAPIIIEGKKGDPGERGLPGEKGDSITLVNSSVTPEGDTQVNLSDGSSFIVKKGIDGTNGLNGMDGKSITLDRTETDSLGNTTVYLSDGSSFTVQKGDKGDKGDTGDKGQDGTSVTIRSTSVADNGDVELHFSDGTIVPIPKGEKGADGRDGVDGHDKVQVSDTEPTDPNIVLWVKPNAVPCSECNPCEKLDVMETLSNYDTTKEGNLSKAVYQSLSLNDTRYKDITVEGLEEKSKDELKQLITNDGANYNEIIDNFTVGDGNIGLIRKGQPVTVTYNNINDSFVNGTKISKIVFKYTLVKNSLVQGDFNNKDNQKEIDYAPIQTLKFVTGTLRYVGFDTDIKTEVTFLDEKGNPINLKDTLVNFSSLNSFKNDGTEYEGVSNFNGEFIKFNGSSIDNHNGLAYSPTSNDKVSDGSEFNSSEWDNNSDKSYYGSIVGQIKSDTDKTMFDIVSKGTGYTRFIFKSYKNDKIPIYPKEVKTNSKDCGVLRYKDQNGNWLPFPTLRGEKGQDGKDGQNGTNGRDGIDGKSITITEEHQDDNGNTIITFSDGTVVLVNRGEKGEKGQDGTDGHDGRDGLDGVNGTNGTDGRDGRDGRDGKDLSIKKTFPSIETMNADTSLSEGDLVMISSNPDDEDNAKLYVKTANGYNYITDLSGANGIKGESGRDGRDGKDGKDLTLANKEFLDNGDTKVTLSDGNSFVVQKGADGQRGADGANGKDGAKGADGKNGKDLTVKESHFDSDGNTIVTLSDDSVLTIHKGEKGDSITVASARELSNGDKRITFTDGKYVTIPKGEKGDKGDTGQQGEKGAKGDKGEDGHSPVITIDPKTGHWKVDGKDTGVNGKAPELPYDTITGVGRPDKPNTTGGKIKGNEDDATEYFSTDGAGVGAQLWKKINGKWVVIKGDTGWRKIESSNLASGYVLFRRTNDSAFITADGGKYNTIKIASNATVESVQMGESGQNRNRITLVKIPTGWGSKTTVAGQVVTHDGYDILGNAVVTAVGDQNALQIRNYTGNKTQNQLLRFPMITYPTTVEWATSLPGTAVDY